MFLGGCVGGGGLEGDRLVFLEVFGGVELFD